MADNVTVPGIGQVLAMDEFADGSKAGVSRIDIGTGSAESRVNAANPFPVVTPTNATTTREYNYPVGQRIASLTAQTRSTAIAATEVMLHASQRCFVRAGDLAVSATVGAGSFPLETGEKFHMRITSGQFISTIRDTTDGFLTIMPVV